MLVPFSRASKSRRSGSHTNMESATKLLPFCYRMPPNSRELAGRRLEKNPKESNTYVRRFLLSSCENWLLIIFSARANCQVLSQDGERAVGVGQIDVAAVRDSGCSRPSQGDRGYLFLSVVDVHDICTAD